MRTSQAVKSYVRPLEARSVAQRSCVNWCACSSPPCTRSAWNSACLALFTPTYSHCVCLLPVQIASAGFSQIYKAFYTGDNGETRIVAAKVLTTGITHTAARAEPVLKRLYDRELAALSAVKHKHVIE